MSAVGEMLVAVGRPQLGLGEVIPARTGAARQGQRVTITVPQVDALPTNWFGYDGVDVLVLSTSDDAVAQFIR